MVESLHVLASRDSFLPTETTYCCVLAGNNWKPRENIWYSSLDTSTCLAVLTWTNLHCLWSWIQPVWSSFSPVNKNRNNFCRCCLYDKVQSELRGDTEIYQEVIMSRQLPVHKDIKSMEAISMPCHWVLRRNWYIQASGTDCHGFTQNKHVVLQYV